jgi:Pentapeptide repeats (8 copies)
MGSIPKILGVVLLVGCLDIAVVMAFVRVCGTPYKGRTLTHEELTAVFRNHEAWLKSGRKLDDKRKANLCQANLSKAQLCEANLQEANPSQANLRGADLW